MTTAVEVRPRHHLIGVLHKWDDFDGVKRLQWIEANK